MNEKKGEKTSARPKNREGRKPDDQTGLKYGRLTPTQYAGDSSWLCVCDCGKKSVVKTSNLTGGHVKSCGCLRDDRRTIKHGHARNKRQSPTYQTWQSMLRRCFKQDREDYYLYGERGITVCAEWLEFKNFLRDMGEKPSGLSLGRIENWDNYKPSNCRWETAEEQGNNTRRNHVITIGGETKTVSRWARQKGVKADMIYCRLGRGWSEHDAVMKPKRVWYG